ncbi:MAG: hypothetical protein KIT79_07040 [Deltaproteobacteria bacterium]|nr:hypothetical protein [Deltaproteobacteria bacterium]
MTAFDDAIARPELQPVWVVEFHAPRRAIAALPAHGDELICLEEGESFGGFPATGYLLIGNDEKTGEIVRYVGRSPDGTAITGLVRGRFRSAAREWPGGTVVREWGLGRVFSTLPVAAFPDALPILLDPALSPRTLDEERLTSAVGSFTFRLADMDSFTSTLIALTPLRRRGVTLWLGFPGITEPEGFRAVARGRVQEVTSDDGGAIWRFQCRSLLADLKDQRLFLDRRSRLTGAVTGVQTSLPVADTGRYLPNTGGLVRHVRVGDEIVSYAGRSTASGAGNLTGCVRGLFQSVAAAHEAGDEAVQVYELSGHPLTILLNILATTETGGSGPYDDPAFRGGAALGLDPDLVNTGQIEQTRDSLLPALFARFLIDRETDDAKRWIEEELLQACGAALIEESGGRLSVRFMGPPSPAETPAVLDAAARIPAGERMDLGLGRIRNAIEIRYSRDPVDGVCLERLLYLDADSVSRHGAAPKLTLEFGGLHGPWSPLGDHGGDAHALRLASRLALQLSHPRPRLRTGAAFGLLTAGIGDTAVLAHGRLPPGQPDESLPPERAAKDSRARLVEIVSTHLDMQTGMAVLDVRESPFEMLRYAFIHRNGAPDFDDADVLDRQYAHHAGDSGPDYAIYPA